MSDGNHKTEEINERCSACKFLGNQKLGGYECRRYPPVDTWMQYNQYPTTRLDQSCGEWKHRVDVKVI